MIYLEEIIKLNDEKRSILSSPTLPFAPTSIGKVEYKQMYFNDFYQNSIKKNVGGRGT